MQKLRNNNQGFTIIEVLIVLAIAALIMLIVFLAVPALQRNSRNNARNNDASRVASAVTECLANRNGQITGTNGCQNLGQINYGTLSQLTNVSVGTSAVYATNGARIWYNSECDAAGSEASGGGGGSRSFTVTFELEGDTPTGKGSDNNIHRCI